MSCDARYDRSQYPPPPLPRRILIDAPLAHRGGRAAPYLQILMRGRTPGLGFRRGAGRRRRRPTTTDDDRRRPHFTSHVPTLLNDQVPSGRSTLSRLRPRRSLGCSSSLLDSSSSSSSSDADDADAARFFPFPAARLPCFFFSAFSASFSSFAALRSAAATVCWCCRFSVLGGLGGGFRRGRARTLDAQVVADRVDLVVLLRLLHFAALLAHAHDHRADRRHRRKLHLAYTRTETWREHGM